jgi:branched-subunit amino acid aminotransferase/4-amino-4-deoxychorismate lyase
MRKYCYFEGKIIPLEKAKISPYDLGILRGYCVFDVMCTQNGKPFLLSKHWKRFQNSAKELMLKIPVNQKKYEKIVEKLIKLNGFEKSTVRTVLSGGLSSDGFSLENGNETFYILVEKFKKLPEECFQKGAKLITLEFFRNFPKAKIANYIAAIKNQNKKKKSKALEIIYTSQGKVLEASTSNFFIVKNGIIATPKEKILLGITRNLVVNLARKNKFKVEERDISMKDFLAADEIFLAATNKDIVPIVNVDGGKIGNGKVGKVTKRLMDIFESFVKKY